MTELSRNIEVGWQHRVFFTRDVFHSGNSLLPGLLTEDAENRPPRVLATVDSGAIGSLPALRERIEETLAMVRREGSQFPNVLEIPGGEQCKNDPDVLWKLVEQIHQRGLCRRSYIVAVGGGAHLDLVGFAASLVHRGVRLIRVPTTCLSQADSGVGVKNGVNAFGKKNFLGTFAPPHAVILDTLFLETMPIRELRCGFAEAIKVALIRDASFFDWIEAHVDSLLSRELAVVETLVRRCATLHLDHIANSGDPFEKGTSRPLDFGHWAAHRLEAMSGFTVRHGEAVAVGLAIDSIYSCRCGSLGQPGLSRILNLLRRFGFSLRSHLLAVKQKGDLPALLEGLEEFREHLGGELTVTLLAGIGKAVEVHCMDRGRLLSALEELNKEPE